MLPQLLNILRVSEETEKMGLDAKEHGGAAYEVTSRKSRFSGGNYNFSTAEVVVNNTASNDV